MNAIKSVVSIMLKFDIFHVPFNIVLIVLMSIFGRFYTYSYLHSVGTGNHLKKNLGLLQYCIFIIYIMNSLLFSCAYSFVYCPIFS